MFDKLILIIDTEIDFLRIKKISAENNPNIDFINAPSEQLACEILTSLHLKNKLPNLIFIDINIFKDATNLLKLLKENKKLQIIPIIALVNNDLSILKKETTFNCLLPKPDDEKEFEKVIQSIFFFWFKIAKLPNKNYI